MYKAIVAKIDKIQPISGADNIQSATVLGNQVVIGKDWKAGSVGLFFPADCQLSVEYCRANNLFRDASKNIDVTQKGFFDNNRRVRCQPFMKVKSEGLFMPLESTAYMVPVWSSDHFKLGDSFDKLFGIELCRKYISEHTQRRLDNITKNGKKVKAVETPLFHKHTNTDQFLYNIDNIPAGALLSFHAKLHGTSQRFTKTKVVKSPTTFRDKLLNKFGMFNSESWEYLGGTRNVTLYQHETDKEGFHGSEQFRFDAMRMVKPYLEEGMTIYGELSGYANGSPIMGKHDMSKLKDKAYTKKYGKEVIYTYGCTEDQFRLDIYRITYTNNQGVSLDFTYPQLKAWCLARDLIPSLEVHEPFIYTGTPYARKKLVGLMEELVERPDVLAEDYIDPSHISEGVVLRVDHEGQTPKFYKQKSYAFKVLESIIKEDFDYEDAM